MLIDPYQESWLDELSLPAGEMMTYLFIDGAFVPGLYRLVDAQLPPSQSATLLFEALPACSDKTRNVSPFIVPYARSSSGWQAVLAHCSGWPMVSAIETPESQAELAERLAAWCVVEAGAQHFNFRFPDTRRLPVIFEALTPTQRLEFAGPAVRWSYIDRRGRWAQLDVPASAFPIAERPTLDDQQFSRLVDASEVDEVLAILERRGLSLRGRRSDLYAGIAIALRAADRRHLPPESKIEWCESCLLAGLPCDETEAGDRLTRWLDLAEPSLSN